MDAAFQSRQSRHWHIPVHVTVGVLGLFVVSEFPVDLLSVFFFNDHHNGQQALAWIYPVFYLLMLVTSPSAIFSLSLSLPGAVTAWLAGLYFLGSSAWSVEPEISLRRAILLLTTIAFGVYLARWLSIKTFCVGLIVVCISAIIVSLVLLPVLPEKVLLIDKGVYLQGVFSHRNNFGKIAGLGVFAVLALSMVDNHRLGQRDYVCMVLCFGVLIGTRSVTSILTSIFVVTAFLCIDPRYKSLKVPVVMALSTISMLVLFNRHLFFAEIGKDSTLTGRTEIWEYSINVWQQRPWFGYGYRAIFYWNGIETGAIAPTNLGLVQAHNGYVSALVDGGIIGEGLLIILLLDLGWNCWTLRPQPLTRITLIMISMVMIYNITENSLFRFNDIHFVTLVFLRYKMAIAQWNSVRIRSPRDIILSTLRT